MLNNTSHGGAAFEPASVAEREARIVGQPPRIAPLGPDEIDDEAIEVIRGIRRAIGVDPDVVETLPAFVSTILRHPALYRVFTAYGLQLLRGALSPRHRELVILRTGWLCRAPLEWGEHVEIGKRCGLTTEEIERITRGSSDPAWEASERALVRAAEELHADAMITDETWSELAKFLDEKQLIELPFLVGQYTMVAYHQNALRLRPLPTNRGLAAR
jgi:alkylhydroperoxidase family enzyme